jgi:hypothetical protein
MPSSEMGSRVALVITDVSEERIEFLIRVLVIVNVVLSSRILYTMMMETIRFSETQVLTRAIRSHIPENDILHSHRCENFKSYIA